MRAIILQARHILQVDKNKSSWGAPVGSLHDIAKAPRMAKATEDAHAWTPWRLG